MERMVLPLCSPFTKVGCGPEVWRCIGEGCCCCIDNPPRVRVGAVGLLRV